MLASIPSPSSNGFYIGPLFFHFYGLCYVVGIIAAILLTRRLWRERGGNVDLVHEVAIIGVPAGIVGARLYHDITSWNEVPHNWWGWLAVLGRRPGDLGRDRRRRRGRHLAAASSRRQRHAVHGRGRPGAAGGAGDRPGR